MHDDTIKMMATDKLSESKGRPVQRLVSAPFSRKAQPVELPFESGRGPGTHVMPAVLAA